MRALSLAALLAFLLPATPAAADGGWIPATLTCAGIWGTMADGNAVHYGAVAEPYWRPYPLGTVIELGDGGRWTIEDTLAPWVGGSFGRFDLYIAWGWACTQFGVRPGWARVVRYGWGGN